MEQALHPGAEEWMVRFGGVTLTNTLSEMVVKVMSFFRAATLFNQPQIDLFYRLYYSSDMLD